MGTDTFGSDRSGASETPDTVGDLFAWAFGDDPEPTAAPEPPELTDDAIRSMFDRAFDAEPEPSSDELTVDAPEITEDAVREMLASLGRTDDEDDTATSTETGRTESAGSATTSSLPSERQCPSCYGGGTSVCTSCYGSGYHTTSYTTTDWEGNVEYVTDQYPCGCAGGYVTCGRCGGRGTIYR